MEEVKYKTQDLIQSGSFLKYKLIINFFMKENNNVLFIIMIEKLDQKNKKINRYKRV